MSLDPSRALALTDARLAAHHAAALLADFAFTWLPHEPTFAFANLDWRGRTFWTREAGGITLGLELPALRWTLRRGEEELAARNVDATGRPRDWLAEVGRAAGLPDRAIDGPEWDLPAPGGPATAEDLDQLADWFDLAHTALAEVQMRLGSSPVRTWPHHFDIATLLALDPGVEPEEARSVGIGLSPGDASISQPYFYVTPWPYPNSKAGPMLPWNGYWHSAGWFGAVLRGADVPDADGANYFLQLAVDGALGMLDTEER